MYVIKGDYKMLIQELKRFDFESEHEQDCCENVYADFENADWWLFDESKYKNIREVANTLEIVEQVGFRIGGVFVACYDSQNGYYSNNLTLIIIDKTTQERIKIDITDATKPDYN